jgi:hypothetical protein
MDALCPQDLTDDRLADVLRLLSDDVHWHAFEQELMGQLVRVYDVRAACVRIDTTTASSYGDVNEQGLLQLGLSQGSSSRSASAQAGACESVPVGYAPGNRSPVG